MENYLVDSHCHLTMMNDEENIPIAGIVERALKNNVKIMNNIGTEIYEFAPVIKTVETFESVYASLGIHPSNAENNKITLEELVEYLRHPKVIGVGETGLEYHFEPMDKKLQKKYFEMHIEAARREKLPLIIHSRDADEDMIEMLESEMKNSEFSFLLHCFSSGERLCYKALDLDGYISLSGIITFKNAQDLRNIIKNVPTNKLLVETDSPFLAPMPFRGCKNEPAYVKNVAEYTAEFFGISFEEMVKVTTQNFLRLFDKVSVV